MERAIKSIHAELSLKPKARCVNEALPKSVFHLLNSQLSGETSVQLTFSEELESKMLSYILLNGKIYFSEII